MIWADAVAHIEEMRNTYKLLVGKPKMKRLLGKIGHRWEDKITMDPKVISPEGVYWINPAQDRKQ
jgi:hypothetical protein